MSRAFSGLTASLFVVIASLLLLAPPASAAGGRIVYVGVRDKKTAIYSIRADGGPISEVPGTNGGSHPALSRDGRKVVFTAPVAGGTEIHTIAIDGGGEKQVTDSRETYDYEPAFSDDGSRITFVRNHQIFVIDADGSHPKQVTGEGRNNDPAFSPDGRRIVFMRAGQGEQDIISIDSDGGDLKNLTRQTSTGTGHPVYSPNGKRIAFESFARGGSRIVTVDAGDGGDKKVLGLGREPWFAPDGSRLAFIRNDNLLTMAADGSDVVPLDTPPDQVGFSDFDPSWGG